MSRIKGFESLKTKEEFDRVYKKADKVWHTSGFVLFYKRSKTPKVAFVAGKKVGNAIKRNRAKRVLRAHFQLHLNNITKATFIFVAKPKILEQDFKERDRNFVNALKKSNLYLK